jgi:broad specificity phosphatase PhoE
MVCWRPMAGDIWSIRHGETEWSLSGAHTGRTDITLTDAGRVSAERIGRYLSGRRFALVLTSPLARARETCRLAGYGDVARIDPDLREWDYGDYEGLTTAEINRQRSGWSLWKDGVPNGETVEQVAARARRVIDRISHVDGDALLFSHGHLLRILGAVWLELDPRAGKLFALGTAAVSKLGYERETRVITLWNLLVSE